MVASGKNSSRAFLKSVSPSITVEIGFSSGFILSSSARNATCVSWHLFGRSVQKLGTMYLFDESINGEGLVEST